MDERVCADFVNFHEPFADEQGSGTTIHHSHYQRATISTSELHLNF